MSDQPEQPRTEPIEAQDGPLLEYPDGDTRYLMPPDAPSTKAREGVALAESFHASVDGLSIDGKPFPFHVHNVGIQVDQIDSNWHVVYLPVLINGPVTSEGIQDTTLGALVGAADGQASG